MSLSSLARRSKANLSSTSVVIHRQSNSGIPVPTLADALAAQRKSASTVLTFGSLRKPAAPERKPTNAIFLEGVLGFDEGMLKDILRPLTRGLIFSCSWVVSLSTRTKEFRTRADLAR